MWKEAEEIVRAAREQPWGRSLPKDESFGKSLGKWIQEEVLLDFLREVTRQVDEIVDIDPDLSESKILEKATQHVVEFLNAKAAAVQIYDLLTEKIIAEGAYPPEILHVHSAPTLDGNMAENVLVMRRIHILSDMDDCGDILGLERIKRKGVGSMMVLPLEIPRFFPRERDTVGVMYIFFEERGRRFSPLEVDMAGLMARRLSFVMARKKILSMYMLNEKKEAIVRKIYSKLGTREGVRMKDIFDRVIPEIVDITNIQSCALFSVTDDQQYAVLEAGYPEAEGYHSIGRRFKIQGEPAFKLVINLGDYIGESAYDIVTPSYILVVDPQRSRLVSKKMKQFAETHRINSILYVPLEVGEEVRHFMTFDALEQRQRYSDEEIEVFCFLGRELIKAQRMERLDDILHDFKNPAIATAGFARRLKRLLGGADLGENTQEVHRCVDILLEETTRLQELALSVYEAGKTQVVNLTERLKRRFEINQQAIKEQLKQNIKLHRGPFEDPLWVRCYPLHLERVLDNLLNNATNAIPHKGGQLRIRTYSQNEWACAEITNTGLIPEEDRLRLLEGGESRGRGLHITHRIIQLLGGKIDVKVGKETTTFVIYLPMYKEEKCDFSMEGEGKE